MTVSENMGENKVGVGGIKNFFLFMRHSRFCVTVQLSEARMSFNPRNRGLFWCLRVSTTEFHMSHQRTL